MRTVVALTAPVDVAGPNALTQSPTARVDAVAACVADTVVELVVVIVSFSVLGVAAFLALEPEDLLGRPKVPGDRSTPVTDAVEPLTAVTWPLAMAMLPAPAKALPDPGLNVGRVPPVVPPLPLRGNPPPGKPPPPPPGKPAPVALRPN
jgi:hypothetical protein